MRDDVLICLKKRVLRWATAAMVAIYALGILAPAVSFAYADAPSIAHVLSETHGGFLTLHFHHDDGDRDHSKTIDGGHAHHCCGVTSISGLEPGADPFFVAQPPATTLVWPSEQLLADRHLARLDRPPRDFLPL